MAAALPVCSGRYAQWAGDRRPFKKIARQPEAAAPWSNGAALQEWPDRVAIVAFGQWSPDNHKEYVLMRDASLDAEISVDCPQVLENWAEVNGVRIPKTHNGCVLPCVVRSSVVIHLHLLSHW